MLQVRLFLPPSLPPSLSLFVQSASLPLCLSRLRTEWPWRSRGLPRAPSRRSLPSRSSSPRGSLAHKLRRKQFAVRLRSPACAISRWIFIVTPPSLPHSCTLLLTKSLPSLRGFEPTLNSHRRARMHVSLYPFKVTHARASRRTNYMDWIRRDPTFSMISTKPAHPKEHSKLCFLFLFHLTSPKGCNADSCKGLHYKAVPRLQVARMVHAS